MKVVLSVEDFLQELEVSSGHHRRGGRVHHRSLVHLGGLGGLGRKPFPVLRGRNRRGPGLREPLELVLVCRVKCLGLLLLKVRLFGHPARSSATKTISSNPTSLTPSRQLRERPHIGRSGTRR